MFIRRSPRPGSALLLWDRANSPQLVSLVTYNQPGWARPGDRSGGYRRPLHGRNGRYTGVGPYSPAPFLGRGAGSGIGRESRMTTGPHDPGCLARRGRSSRRRTRCTLAARSVCRTCRPTNPTAPPRPEGPARQPRAGQCKQVTGSRGMCTLKHCLNGGELVCDCPGWCMRPGVYPKLGMARACNAGTRRPVRSTMSSTLRRASRPWARTMPKCGRPRSSPSVGASASVARPWATCTSPSRSSVNPRRASPWTALSAELWLLWQGQLCAGL